MKKMKTNDVGGGGRVALTALRMEPQNNNDRHGHLLRRQRERETDSSSSLVTRGLIRPVSSGDCGLCWGLAGAGGSGGNVDL